MALTLEETTRALSSENFFWRFKELEQLIQHTTALRRNSQKAARY